MKKKLFKSFVAISVSALSAFGLAAAGCGDKDGHNHTWGDYISDGSVGHYRVCLDGDGTDEQAHTYGDDYECDLCHFVNYVGLDTDDVNDDVTVPTYNDVTGTPAPIAEPKIVAHTGNGPALVEGQQEVVYEFDAADMAKMTYAEGWTDGIFSISAGTEIRDRANKGSVYDGNSVASGINYKSVNSVKLGDDVAALSIKISDPGELVLYVMNGSSGVTGMQGLKIVVPNGSQVPTSVEYPANGNSSHIQLVKLNLDVAGEYKIMRTSGTSDIFYAKFTYTATNTAIEKIKITDAGKVDYMVGQQLDCTGIVVNTIHKVNGKILPVNAANLVLDTSKYDGTKAGTYEIGVSYTVDGNLGDETTFTATYNVNVYAFDGLELGFNKIIKGSNSKAGNGVYANHAVKQFYFKGATFSDDGLSIKAIGKLGDKTKIFDLDQTQATVTASTAAVGKTAVKVSYTAN